MPYYFIKRRIATFSSCGRGVAGSTYKSQGMARKGTKCRIATFSCNVREVAASTSKSKGMATYPLHYNIRYR